MIVIEPQVVIKEAKRLLRQSSSPIAKKLSISSEFVSEGDWLHLIATPTTSGGSALDFVDEIERIESALRKQFGDNILIVPAKP